VFFFRQKNLSPVNCGGREFSDLQQVNEQLRDVALRLMRFCLTAQWRMRQQLNVSLDTSQQAISGVQ